MNPLTSSAGLKKPHLFVQSLVEGPFLCCLFFSLNFIFLDLFFSYSFFCKCSPCNIKFVADCICYHIRGLLEKYPTVFFYANT